MYGEVKPVGNFDLFCDSVYEKVEEEGFFSDFNSGGGDIGVICWQPRRSCIDDSLEAARSFLLSKL